MKPFTYVLPTTLAEAAAAAQKDGALLKAAGVDVVDLLKERKATPDEVVNLLPLTKDLAGIATEASGGLRIGALTTLTNLEQAAALAGPAFRGLREAAGTPATPQVRNRATAAGNVLQTTRCWYLRAKALPCLHGKDGPTCRAQTGENRYHAILGYHDCVRVHPSNLAPALLAFDAEYTTFALDADGKGRQRRRKLAELFPSEPTAEQNEHTLEPGEIVTAFHVPAPAPGTGSSYRESREKLSFDWATTACAVRVVMDGGVIVTAAIVLGAVAPVPLPVPRASRLLVGKAPSDELFQTVATAALAGARPLTHNGYKVPVAKAIVREALHEACKA